MSGAPRGARSSSELEVRSVLGPAGNKTATLATHHHHHHHHHHHRKPLSNFVRSNSKSDNTPPPAASAATTTTLEEDDEEDKRTTLSPSQEEESFPRSQSQSLSRSSSLTTRSVSSVLRRRHEHQHLLHSNLSLNASCSSDVSSDSLQSRASTGKIGRSTTTSTTTSSSIIRRRRKQCLPKSDNKSVVSDTDSSASSLDVSSHPHSQGGILKRCAWVTSNTEPCYATFHDEEWGVPAHDDKKLFELLVFSGALAELTWPTILMKRHIFREVFADFDPVSVSKLNEKKITAPGSTAISLLSELKLRAIVENARQITKIIDEFGSFEKYIWSFVNNKPILNKFRYPRQVPAKTSKADVISKDLLKRGFRSVSATVIYSFMQVAGITNDHLITCFRYHQCTNPIEHSKEDSGKVNAEEKSKDMLDMGLATAMDELSFPSE